MQLCVCVQGTFLQCKKASTAAAPGADDVVHYYHESCQVVRDEKSLCPHCGEQSTATELEVTAVYRSVVNYMYTTYRPVCEYIF